MKVKDVARLRPYIIHKNNKIENERRLRNIFRHKYTTLLSTNSNKNSNEIILPSINTTNLLVNKKAIN